MFKFLKVVHTAKVFIQENLNLGLKEKSLWHLSPDLSSPPFRSQSGPTASPFEE